MSDHLYPKRTPKDERCMEQSQKGERVNLNELFNTWRTPARCVLKNDDVSVIVDFIRQYLVRATEPCFEIQRYTFRTTGRYKRNPSLQDLPEHIVCQIVGCILDAMRLGSREVMELEAEDLIASPTRYWETLGDNDEARKKAFEMRKKERSIWEPYCRSALARAMADIRQYVLMDNMLLPRPKHGGSTESVDSDTPPSSVSAPASSVSGTDGEGDYLLL
ncbi:hypothetical protein Q1695_006175 [Nippostrongylus brasiliensis]|nr:hypothetical protein Q1695_006175 [Nippostrongylus brasiliensis]